MALKQKDIAVSEFFAKNRHLLDRTGTPADAVVDLLHRCALGLSSDRDLTRGAMRRSVGLNRGAIRIRGSGWS